MTVENKNQSNLPRDMGMYGGRRFAWYGIFMSLTVIITAAIFYELTMTTRATYSGKTNAIIRDDRQINTNIVRDCLCDACCMYD